MRATSAGPKRCSRRMSAGLSRTARSLKPGGRGSRALAYAPRWRCRRLGRLPATTVAEVRPSRVRRQVGHRQEEGLGRGCAAADVVERLRRVVVGLVGLSAALSPWAARGRAIECRTPAACRSRSGSSCGSCTCSGRPSRTTPATPRAPGAGRACRSRSGTCRRGLWRSRPTASRPAACSTSRACRSRPRGPSCPARRCSAGTGRSGRSPATGSRAGSRRSCA